MRDSTLRIGLLLGLALWPWACAENDGVLLFPDPASDAGDAPEAPASDAAPRDASISDGDPDASGDADAEPECSDGHFCRTKLPTDDVIHSLWGAPDGSLWAGTRRAILEWDGTSWKVAFSWPEDGAPHVRARMIAGSGPEDVWAFGDGSEFDSSGLGRPKPAIAHLARRGSQLSWRVVTSDIRTPFATAGQVYVAGPSDLWLAWGYGGIWHGKGEDANGHLVTELEVGADGQPVLPEMPTVWGFGTDRVFIAGNDVDSNSHLFRRAADGTWVDAPAPNAGGLSIRGGTDKAGARLWLRDNSSHKVLPVAADGTVLAPDVDRAYGSVPSCSPTLVAAVRGDLAWTSDGSSVCRYDGTSFTLVPISLGGYPRLSVKGIWSNGTDTWIVGEERPLVAGGLSRGFALHRKEGT